MKIRIQHCTAYNYSEPVSFGPHKIMIRPREGHDLHIESSILDIQPAHTIRWMRDVNGNSIAKVEFTEKAAQLRIYSELILQHYDANPLDFILEEHAVHYPFVYEPDSQVELGAFTHIIYPKDTETLRAWLAQFWKPGDSVETIELLQRLNLHIFKTFKYQRRDELGVQTPAETLQKNSGSCRDFATLLLEAFRCWGLAARFVSGYMQCEATEAGGRLDSCLGRSLSARRRVEGVRSDLGDSHRRAARCGCRFARPGAGGADFRFVCRTSSAFQNIQVDVTVVQIDKPAAPPVQNISQNQAVPAAAGQPVTQQQAQQMAQQAPRAGAPVMDMVIDAPPHASTPLNGPRRSNLNPLMIDMRILVIDDEVHIRKTTTLTLDALGHECEQAATSAEALSLVQKSNFDAAFLDLRLGNEDGLELIPKLIALEPKLNIIVFTAYTSIDSAVEAMRRGAVDYIAKPFTPEQIRQALSRIENNRRLENRVVELESMLSGTETLADFATQEPLVQKLFETATKAASSAATLLLLGESGTGKSVLARALHKNSPRRDNAFVTVACPSLSRELLESELFGHVRGAFTGAVGETWGKVKAAEGGTLFLDEIGELPSEIQPKLLRLLQEREYERVGDPKPRKANVRVIAATNRRLEDLVKEGKFREDLYYRLNVITIEMPPLRQRPLDLPALAQQHLQMFARQSARPIKGVHFRRAGRDATLPMAGQPARVAQCHRACGHSRAG